MFHILLQFLIFSKYKAAIVPEERSHSKTNEVRHQKWMPQANHLQVAGRVLTLWLYRLGQKEKTFQTILSSQV